MRSRGHLRDDHGANAQRLRSFFDEQHHWGWKEVDYTPPDISAMLEGFTEHTGLEGLYQNMVPGSYKSTEV